MDSSQLNWIANFIWGIADDVLRDLYVRGKYRDVILPMTVLRRLDAVLEPTKQAVLDMKASLDKAKIVHQDQALRQAAGQAFYNTSKFTLRDLRARASQQQLKADFEAYLDGFSPNVQDILENFEFRNQIPRLSKADALGTLIEKLLSPDINLSPNPVLNGDGSVKHPGLDNHGMGTVFEELVRRFNEENNEEAGEHWTPRDAVKLMAKLIFLPIADEIESGTYLLYDGACGTGGMLTVAEETLQQLAASTASRSPRTSTARRSTPRPTPSARPTCCSRAKATPPTTSSAARSTRRSPTMPSRRREFDFMLSNPPYGKSWKTDLERMGGKDGHQGPALPDRARGRPGVLADHPLERRPDAVPGQHALQDEARHAARQPHRRGAQRQLAVHRRRRPGREQHPPLDHRERLAGGHRRPAAQHVLQHRHRHLHLGAQNRKPAHRQGKVQLIDATAMVQAAAQEPGQEELRAVRRGHRAHLRHVPRLRGDRAVEDLPERGVRLLEGHRRAAAAPRRASTRSAPTPPRRSRRSRRAPSAPTTRPPVIRKIHKKGTAADPLRGLFETTIDGKPARGRVRARLRPARHRAGAAARGGRHRGLPPPRGAAARRRTPGTSRTASRSATRSASRATSTSRSRCARWRRSARTSWRWRRRPKGCSARSSGEPTLMKEIRGDAKNIRALLGGAKFAIDYYQREYRWETKQVAELIDDLAEKFLRQPRARQRAQRCRAVRALLPRLDHHQRQGRPQVHHRRPAALDVAHAALIHLHRQLEDDDQKEAARRI